MTIDYDLFKEKLNAVNSEIFKTTNEQQVLPVLAIHQILKECEVQGMTKSFMICVDLGQFIEYTVGEIYKLAPYHKPRFIDEIVDEIIRRFKADCKNIGKDFFYHEVELKDLYKFIENILMPIDKFRDLNLSKIEYEQGISVDDEDRPKFQFTSTYSSVPEEDNFIDLDACIQNIFTRYEHTAFREYEYGEMDINKLSNFRKAYMET